MIRTTVAAAARVFRRVIAWLSDALNSAVVIGKTIVCM